MAPAACFPPVADARTRVLILGSLPGQVSLARAQYYAHPQNQFWRLLGAVIGQDLAGQPYDSRLQALLAARIGLWDVVALAERIGSLDTAIRNPRANALEPFAATLPSLRAIGFNGATSARIGRRQLGALPIPCLALPSSSAAHASMPFAAKRDAWLALRAYL